MTAIPPDARALTIRQPWASLIALGVKTIETRSWSTAYRGPLVIHAGKAVPASGVLGFPVYRNPSPTMDGWFALDCKTGGWLALPLGAVVAVVDLVDVVPIVDELGLTLPDRSTYVQREQRTTGVTEWWLYNDETGRCADVTGQEPYGDFTPGRYAWLLDNIRPVDPPVPAKGRQGLWRWNP